MPRPRLVKPGSFKSFHVHEMSVRMVSATEKSPIMTERENRAGVPGMNATSLE
jgi:hypothetical protein